MGSNLDLRSIANFGQYLSAGLSWEWSALDWYLSGETALDNAPPRIHWLPDSTGTWRPAQINRTFSPSWALQLQHDVHPFGAHTMRVSLEWVAAPRELSTSQAREVGTQLDLLSQRSKTHPQVNGLLADFASTQPWLDGYAHRLLVRLGSVESMRWGFGVNTLFVGPSDGILLLSDLHATLTSRLTFETKVSTLAWSRTHSLLAQLPNAAQACAGFAWRFQ
jgi:hypothetical protein